jgi:nicotinamide-nucleotide amidase
LDFRPWTLDFLVVIVEIINTGTELTLGHVLNSHQQWLCRQCSDLGCRVSRQIAVPDEAREIESAVRDSLARADLVITTGGLGPTSDDLTRESIARLLGRRLLLDPETQTRIEAFFTQRNRPQPESTRVEAMVPEGALVLPNRQGTAPGLALQVKPNPFRADRQESWLVMLPGPGREMRPMFAESVVPLLQRVLPLDATFVCRTLRTTGLGESTVQERIQNLLHELVKVGLEVGYCARPGQVDVRLAARGSGSRGRVAEAEGLVRAELGFDIYGTEDEDLAAVVIRLLVEQKATLAVAESCTGGGVAHRLTNVPGASAVFRAGWVTYSNEAKKAFLGVCDETLNRFGAVSRAVAEEMAVGAREANQTDYALSVTGIAGPTGATLDKPVGTVFIALASRQGVEVRHQRNAWDRVTFKEVTAQQALNQLRVRLLMTVP